METGAEHRGGVCNFIIELSDLFFVLKEVTYDEGPDGS